ncbi:unnamed protein product [Heterobilharzia americana]|nr:unnamed protein product [Heterobilharzia americana]
MFPCASDSKDRSHIGNDLSDNETWLRSSTYCEQKPSSYHIHVIDRVNNNGKELEKTINKRLHSHKRYDLMKKKPKITPNARIDKSCNKEIYRHECIYDKHIPQFKMKNKTNMLGFKDLYLCDLLGTERKRKSGVTKKFRYFSKSSRAVIQAPTVSIESYEASHDMLSDLIPLPDGITVACKPTVELKNNVILSLCEELNRRVYDRPNDLVSWLNLIDMQDKGASFLHITGNNVDQKQICNDFKLSKSDWLVILRKQLSIADRALTANPGNLTLKLLIIKLNDLVAELEVHGALESTSGKDVYQADQINRDWAQFVFTYPQVVSIWRGYTAHLMGRHSSLTTVNQGVGNGIFSRIDGVYKRGLSTLSGIISGRILSHRAQPDTVERTIDFLADYCHWLAQAELEKSSFDQRILEMELYWSSGVARFGQPGSQHWNGWYKTRNRRQEKLKSNESQSSKTIASTCEDALINCSGEGIPDESYEKTGPDVVPSILSSEVAADQWDMVHLEGRSRAILYRRGKAWVGLERAREAVGWLPSDVLNIQDQKAIEDEDPDRLVLFDDVKPCLIDLWKYEEKPTVDTSQCQTRKALLQQRLFLLCLEFLGAYDREVAKTYNFPTDIRLVHDLSSVGTVQRQGLTPFPSESWISSNSEISNQQNDINHKNEQLNTPSQLANEHQDVWSQAHRCFIDSAIVQMNDLPFFASERLSNAIQTHLANVKTAISIWRNCGRTIISEGRNQRDLNLWRAYARGFWQISQDLLATATSQDAEIPIQESRRIFDSALSMKLPLSLVNASSCHGLLPPLFLASLIHKLNYLRQNVAKLAAQSIIIEQTLNNVTRTNTRQQLITNLSDSIIGEEVNSCIGYQLELSSVCLPSVLDLFQLSLELERWTSLIAGVSCEYGQERTSISDQRVRNAFEKAVQTSPFITPILSPEGGLIHVALAASTPSFWSAHLRLVIWRAYMAFGWMAGPPHISNPSSSVAASVITNNLDPRQRRQAVKAVFYRAIEDVPWAKVLYTDLVRYCPEDVEEVVERERELRLRTPLEEVDLLLTSKPHD